MATFLHFSLLFSTFLLPSHLPTHPFPLPSTAVGLAGSSAIVIAAFRALLSFFSLPLSALALPLDHLPHEILAIEQVELGIVAGPQDRVIQVYEGCVYMEFDEEVVRERGGVGRYTSIDSGCT